MNYGDIYKIEHKRPEDSHFAFDWFRDNQLLSQLTHAHNRDTVPLTKNGLLQYLSFLL